MLFRNRVEQKNELIGKIKNQIDHTILRRLLILLKKWDTESKKPPNLKDGE